MRRVTSTVFGSRLAVAITSVIVTTVIVAGGIAVASVPNNSVGTRKIIDNSIRSRDIRNGAVHSVDIRDRTIRVRDLAPGARPQPDNDAVVRIVPDGSTTVNIANDTCDRGTSGLFGHCDWVVPIGSDIEIVSFSGFVVWGGDAAACGSSPACTLTVTGDLNVTASNP